jgi:Skp family chaperone for outer membrane proteins
MMNDECRTRSNKTAISFEGVNNRARAGAARCSIGLLAVVFLAAAGTLFGQESRGSGTPGSAAAPAPAASSVVFPTTRTTNAALSPARGSGPKIAFVDIDIVISRSRYVRRVVESLKKQIEGKRDSLERKQIESLRLKEEIERKRAVLSDKELQELTRQSRELRRTIDDEEGGLEKFMTDADKDQMGPASDRVRGVVEALGKEERFDLILRGEVVLFSNPAWNLTNQVIERLDRDEKTSGTLQGKEPPKASETPAKAAAPAVKTGEAPVKAKETPRASARKSPSRPAPKPTPEIP